MGRSINFVASRLLLLKNVHIHVLKSLRIFHILKLVICLIHRDLILHHGLPDTLNSNGVIHLTRQFPILMKSTNTEYPIALDWHT